MKKCLRFGMPALLVGALLCQPMLAAANDHAHTAHQSAGDHQPADTAARKGIVIEQGYTFPSRPGVPNVGVYFDKVLNAGEQADQLVSVHSRISQRAELHEMQMDGEVMRMRELPQIDLPAGAEVDMAKGSSYHVMLIGLKEPLKAGQSFDLVLNFRHAPAQTVRVEVREAAGKAGHGSHGHGGHGAHGAKH